MFWAVCVVVEEGGGRRVVVMAGGGGGWVGKVVGITGGGNGDGSSWQREGDVGRERDLAGRIGERW